MRARRCAATRARGCAAGRARGCAARRANFRPSSRDALPTSNRLPRCLALVLQEGSESTPHELHVGYDVGAASPATPGAAARAQHCFVHSASTRFADGSSGGERTSTNSARSNFNHSERSMRTISADSSRGGGRARGSSGRRSCAHSARGCSADSARSNFHSRSGASSCDPCRFSGFLKHPLNLRSAVASLSRRVSSKS